MASLRKSRVSDDDWMEKISEILIQSLLNIKNSVLKPIFNKNNDKKNQKFSIFDNNFGMI